MNRHLRLKLKKLAEEKKLSDSKRFAKAQLTNDFMKILEEF